MVGQHTSIIFNIGRTAKVSTSTMGYEPFQNIPIVDADIIYMCTYTEKPYIPIVGNSLSVPSTNHNVWPPLTLRNFSVQVNSTPKIQAKHSTCNDKSMYFCGDSFRIPLSLWGGGLIFFMSNQSNQKLDE